MARTRLLLQLLGTAVATVCVGASSAAMTVASTTAAADSVTAKRCFPDGFLFGSATAAYQVEGAWNETGRTPSIWDEFCREKPGLECANVADDFVHRYKSDIQLMVASGLDSFRFSISWSRVMNWDADVKKMKANAAGIAFYHALIDELKRNGIVPILTLYHSDLPSELQHKFEPQGWLNREIVDHFVQYSELMFTEFGSKVDMWSTFNEPISFALQGYSTGLHAPGLTDSATNVYVATHNLLLSHGRAVQRFRELKKTKVIHEKARISVVLNHDFGYPLDPSNPLDVAAVERRIQFGLGWFSAPIVSGKYPDVMRERVGDRLPEFTPEEAAIVKDSYDLFMLNHYSSHAVTSCDSELSTVSCSDQSLGWERDLGVDESRAQPGARLSSMNENGQYNCKWFTGYPSGYLETIKWMHAQNPTADILLTENGWCGNESIDNQDQLWYFQTYLEEVYKAVTELKIPIIGYTAWSFMDNYEWGSFKPRFGLYYVNFTSETGSKDGSTPKATDLARIPRTAAKWFAQVAKTKCLDGFGFEHIGGDKVVLSDTVPQQTEGKTTTTMTMTTTMVTSMVGLLLLCLAMAMSVVVWVVKRRSQPRASVLRAGESTPLVQPSQ